MAQVAIADIAAIVLLPLVLEPSRALRAAAGGLLVALCILALYAVVHVRPPPADGFGTCGTSRSQRGWALDLRLSLLVLFGARRGSRSAPAPACSSPGSASG